MLNLRYILFLIIEFFLVGCSNSYQNKNVFSNNIQLSQVSLIPLNYKTDSQLIIQFNNNLNKDIDNLIVNIMNSKNSFNHTIDYSDCKFIKSGNSCLIKINFPKETKPGSFILQAETNNYKTSQVINYTLLNDDDNNYTLGIFTKDLKVSYGSKFSIDIPFRSKLSLESSYININGQFDLTNSKIICNNTIDNIKSDQLCNAIIEGIANDKSFSFEIIGYNNNQIFKSNIQNININNQIVANIIPSVTNKIFSPQNNLTISFLNNGSQVASNFNISSLDSDESIITNSCTGTIDINAICSITIKKLGQISGDRTFFATYNNGSTVVSTSFNAYYQANNSVPIIDMSVSNGNLNTFVGTTQKIYLNVSNIGTTTINSIQFSNESKQNTSMQYDPTSSCIINNGNLTPGNSCTLIVNYTPTIAEKNYLKVYAKVNFGQASYTNTQLYIEYTSNLAIMYISATGTNNMFSKCSFTGDGKIYNCGTPINIGNIDDISAFASYKNRNGDNIGFLLRKNGSYEKCIINQYGTFDYCIYYYSSQITNITNAKIININHTYYIYMTQEYALPKRCEINISGYIDENLCTNIIPYNDIFLNNNLNSFDIANGYMYFSTSNNYNIFRCKIDNNGLLSSGCTLDSIPTTSQTSFVITTVNNQKYAYMFNLSSGTLYNLTKCNIQTGSSSSYSYMDGKVFNCSTILQTNNAKGLTILNIKSQQYLYFTDSQSTNVLYRVLIQPDGTVGQIENVLLPGNTLLNNPEKIYFSNIYTQTTIQYDTEAWVNNKFRILPGYLSYQKVIKLDPTINNTQFKFTSSNNKIKVGTVNLTTDSFGLLSIYAESNILNNTEAEISLQSPTINYNKFTVNINPPAFLTRTSRNNTNNINSCMYSNYNSLLFNHCQNLLYLQSSNTTPLDYGIYRNTNNIYFLLTTSYSEKKIIQCQLNPQYYFQDINRPKPFIESNCQYYNTNISNVAVELKKFKDGNIFLYLSNANNSYVENIQRWTINLSTSNLENPTSFSSTLININRGVKISPNENYIYASKLVFGDPSGSNIVKCNLDHNHYILTNTCMNLSFYTSSSTSGPTIGFNNNTYPYNLDFATINNKTYVYFAATDGPDQSYMAINKCTVVESNGNFVECVKWQNNDISQEWSNKLNGLRMVSIKKSINDTWRIYFSDADSSYNSTTDVIKSFSLDSNGNIINGSYQAIKNGDVNNIFVSQIEGIFFADPVN